jgi:hypothetical protein
MLLYKGRSAKGGARFIKAVGQSPKIKKSNMVVII